MLAQKEEIYDLIPQKPPMVMVDKLIDYNEEGVITGFYINEDNILVRNGFLPEAGLIENIAQSAALMIGWNVRNNESKNGTVPIGVIGGIKISQISFLPKIKSEIITEIKVLHEVLNARIISGVVKVNDRVCMECEMKIFLTTEE